MMDRSRLIDIYIIFSENKFDFDFFLLLDQFQNID